MQCKKSIKLIEKIIELSIFLGVLFYNIQIISNISLKNFLFMTLSVSTILILKAVRIYFLLMYNKLSFSNFVHVYLQTTYINLLLPFKLGELYRIYRFTVLSNNMALGVTVVIVDRVFDSLPLCIYILSSRVISGSAISLAFIFIVVFIMIFLLFYFMFGSFYKLLNHFFIFKSESTRGLKALYILKELKKIHQLCENIVKDKVIILLTISTVCWGIEFLTAYLNSSSGNSGIIINYVNAVLFGEYSRPLLLFIQTSSILLLLCMGVEGVLWLKKHRREKNES